MVPGAQKLQKVEFAGDHVPGSHGEGTIEVELHAKFERHVVHAVELIKANCPTLHATGDTSERAQAKPAGQSKQAVTIPPSELKVPALQFVYKDAASRQYAPVGHGIQELILPWPARG